jgi:hypothetical protein
VFVLRHFPWTLSSDHQRWYFLCRVLTGAARGPGIKGAALSNISVAAQDDIYIWFMNKKASWRLLIINFWFCIYCYIYILSHHLGNVLRSLRRLLGDVGCLSCKTWLATDEPWQLTTDDKESWANVVMMLSFGISWASRAGVSVGGSFPLLYSLCILARCSGKLQRSFHPLAFRFGVSRAPQRLDKII